MIVNWCKSTYMVTLNATLNRYHLLCTSWFLHQQGLQHEAQDAGIIITIKEEHTSMAPKSFIKVKSKIQVTIYHLYKYNMFRASLLNALTV